MRHVRHDGLELLKKMEKDHKISEDDHARQSGEVQKATDASIAEVEKMLVAKEKEIMTVQRKRRGQADAAWKRRLRDSQARRYHHVVTGAGRPRVACHGWKAIAVGVEALRKTLRAAGELGISILTIFSVQLGKLVATGV